MVPGAFYQIGLMTLEAIAVAFFLLLLFQLRLKLGLTPLYIAIGSFQYLQVVLALSVYVEVAPGVIISPGSAVLFSSTLFAILLVYIREDADRARDLIYGLLLANITLTLLSSLFGLHLESPLARNFYDLPQALFQQDVRVMVVGTVALVLDVVLIILTYEQISRLPLPFFLRVWIAMSAVLVLDAVVFVTGSFLGRPDYGQLLASNIVGKLCAALLFAAALTIYFRLAKQRVGTDHVLLRARDVFDALSYRQRYEHAREQLTRDALTGLYNRGFFDEILPLELARSKREGVATSLMLIDIDRFKKINDDYGHQQGDRILKLAADAIQSSVREADAACRIGGEEFAVVAPGADRGEASDLAHRIRSMLAHRALAGLPDLGPLEVTATLGVATYPEEAGSSSELVALADERLYRGKRAGRDRVVSAADFDTA